MVWQDGQRKNPSSAQPKKHEERITHLIPIPVSAPHQQETHTTFPSGCNEEHSTEAWSMGTSPIFPGGQSEGNTSAIPSTQSRRESARERDEDGFKLEHQEEFTDWAVDSKAEVVPIEKLPVVDHYCSVTSNPKSKSTEAGHSCQSSDNESTKSCNPSARHNCRRSQDSEFRDTKPKISQIHQITMEIPGSGSMNILSSLEEPKQQSIWDSFLNFESNSTVNTSLSDFWGSSELYSAGAEASDSQMPRSFGAKFAPLDNSVEIYDFGFEEIEEPNYQVFGLKEDFTQCYSSAFVLEDKAIHRSAPSSLSSDELSEIGSWNSLSDANYLEFPSPESMPQYSTSLESSSISMTPSTPKVCDSQTRSADARRKKSARGEIQYTCPINNCPRSETSGGFRRKDHLVQHLRTLHCKSTEELVPGFCPHKGCSYSREPRNEKRVFSTFREYSRHLRSGHDESLFDCPLPGCRRRGANGYSGQANLRRHVRIMHPQIIDKVMADPDYSFACMSDG